MAEFGSVALYQGTSTGSYLNRETTDLVYPENRFEQKNVQTVAANDEYFCPLVLPNAFVGNGTYLIEFTYQATSRTLNRSNTLEAFIGFSWTGNGTTVTFLNYGTGMSCSVNVGVAQINPSPSISYISPGVLGLNFVGFSGLPSPSVVETFYYGVVHKVTDVILTP